MFSAKCFRTLSKCMKRRAKAATTAEPEKVCHVSNGFWNLPSNDFFPVLIEQQAGAQHTRSRFGRANNEMESNYAQRAICRPS